jgi:hypothetical protein
MKVIINLFDDSNWIDAPEYSGCNGSYNPGHS